MTLRDRVFEIIRDHQPDDWDYEDGYAATDDILALVRNAMSEEKSATLVCRHFFAEGDWENPVAMTADDRLDSIADMQRAMAIMLHTVVGEAT